MAFIHDDFLLHSEAARRLYHDYAAPQPIIDYHNHLPPRDIAENRQFDNLFRAWLEGDHYKWRAMRTNGVAERFCTGDASDKEKFLAWVRTVPYTLRNPLYHWTHLELARYFGIDTLLDENSAESVWEEANAKLATPELRVHGILNRFQVVALCTTDDPTDSLSYHQSVAASGLSTHVYPTFRPDKALALQQVEVWNAWTDTLAKVSNTDIVSLSDFETALAARHTFFHEQGCRLSDHGLSHCFADFPSRAEAEAIFDGCRAGKTPTPEQATQLASHLMVFFGNLDAERGWTKQLHLGALRNANSRGQRLLGPDTGFDSIGDGAQAQALAAYLNRLDRDDSLPKTILYNNNPVDNYVFATMAGNFQNGVIPGKVQFGAGWWFLDTKEGIEGQLNALSNTGLLSRFVGMLTDSRSFLSFPRHEYFRRVLCNLIGTDIERGEIPNDEDVIRHQVGPMVENICFANAKNYLGLVPTDQS